MSEWKAVILKIRKDGREWEDKKKEMKDLRMWDWVNRVPWKLVTNFKV